MTYYLGMCNQLRFYFYQVLSFYIKITPVSHYGIKYYETAMDRIFSNPNVFNFSL